MSPYVSVWRWHVTMAASILHRVTGVALYGAALILAGWALALAAGPGAYDQFRLVLGSPPGKLVLIVITFSLFYHLANGVRHLVWDFGSGFQPKIADITAWTVLAFAAIATIAIWVAAGMTGALA
ncbi:MAG TPA: succinate dehydrogenase, cytochrome b556 subunit [Caulobacteraceae bacterium]|jgi:succinate dehydrogenase / fumarate reductase cytochrome b subunit|nr:succinate dehydrogenase, cytochrome b556 subunit [Caulobacteraceae bacterium]